MRSSGLWFQVMDLCVKLIGLRVGVVGMSPQTHYCGETLEATMS